MPIPQPHVGESEDDFHGRCMVAIYEEYKDKENGSAQANAICFQTYRDHQKKAAVVNGPKRLYGRIEKVEEIGDGTVKVHGIASTENEDDQGEVVRGEAMRNAIPDYMRFGAVREMHGLSAAGRALECNCGNDNVTRIVAHVVDPTAVLKVKNRVYNGFSIGGRVLERESGSHKTITKLALDEISLVDRPANPEAIIDLWKSGDRPMPEANGLGTMSAAFAEAMAKTQQFWRCNNPGHMHFKKEEAAACMAKARPQVGDPQVGVDALKGRKEFADGSPPFTHKDDGDGDISAASKVGLPNSPAINPGDPPGEGDGEANFDGDDDADDRTNSAESAGGEFKPEGASDEDFGKKANGQAGDYGNVKYADPGYQKDKKPRYPIDTEGHVRAAWSYINQADNSREYSSEQLGRVKARIRSAARRYGIEISAKAIFDLGDPEALIRSLATSAIDDLLDQLPYDVDSVIEKAGRQQSAADHFLKNVIHDAIGKLTDGQFCEKAANATQDTSGNAEHATPNQGADSGTEHFGGGNATQNTSKRGARHNSMTMGFLRKAHDNMCKAGASCPGHEEVNKASTTEGSEMSANSPNASDDGSDVMSAALIKALEKRNKRLEKTVDAMAQQVQDLRVEMAKASGAPPPPPPLAPEREPKLKKQISAISEQMAAMREKIEQIANTPVQAGASRMPAGIIDVTKSQDGRQGPPSPAPQMAAAEELAKKWEEMSPDDRFAASYAVSRMRPYTQQR